MTASPEGRRAYQRQWMRDRRAEAVAAFGGRCRQCGSVERLQFDHIDPATKTTNAIWAMGKAKREAELAKCQLLCAACHAAKTRAEMRVLTAKRVETRRRSEPRETYEQWKTRLAARVAAKQAKR